jgi:hypothetical protein
LKRKYKEKTPEAVVNKKAYLKQQDARARGKTEKQGALLAEERANRR